MCVARNLTMNGLETRLHEGVHESDKKAFAGCGKHALGGLNGLDGGLGGRNAGNTISNSNHCMSPSQNQSIGKRHKTFAPIVAMQYRLMNLRELFATMHRCQVNQA